MWAKHFPGGKMFSHLTVSNHVLRCASAFHIATHRKNPCWVGFCYYIGGSATYNQFATWYEMWLLGCNKGSRASLLRKILRWRSLPQ
jgi:hypothetical protein